MAMAGGLCSLGVWPVIWNFVERKGRNSAHIYMDYAVTYLVAATTTALTLGQFGSSASSAPNFLEQITQQNAKLVAFAVLSGVCMGVRCPMAWKAQQQMMMNLQTSAPSIVSTSVIMRHNDIVGLRQVGDASMQYAVALLGLSVAPAIINALIIVIGMSFSPGQG